MLLSFSADCQLGVLLLLKHREEVKELILVIDC